MRRSSFRLFRPPSIDEIESRRNDEHCQDKRTQQSADNRASQRCVGLTSGAELKRHWHEAEDRSQRSHKNRPEPHPAGSLECFLQRHSVFQEPVCEFDEENTVGNNDARHHHHAHERHDVQSCAATNEDQQNAAETRRNREENEQRVYKGFELSHEDQIDEHN